MTTFTKAKRSKTWLKIAVTGPSGSGKTYSSLLLARGFCGKDGRIALIDTENGSASNYDSLTDFDVLDIEPPFEKDKYIAAIQSAVKAGYDVLIIDSASHLWKWVLDEKTKMDKRGGNSFTNWNEAGQKLEEAINIVLQSPIHIIFCMRSKMEYVLEQNEKGKQSVTKVGLSPIMRDGIEYEFTTVFDIDIAHNAATSKDRTGLFTDKIETITQDTGRRLRQWRDAGENQAPARKPSREDVLESLTLIYGEGKIPKEKIVKHYDVASFEDLTTEQLQDALESKQRQLRKEQKQ